jgi:hypothetical protein
MITKTFRFQLFSVSTPIIIIINTIIIYKPVIYFLIQLSFTEIFSYKIVLRSLYRMMKMMYVHTLKAEIIIYLSPSFQISLFPPYVKFKS